MPAIADVSTAEQAEAMMDPLQKSLADCSVSFSVEIQRPSS
jgi:hypothetical protein